VDNNYFDLGMNKSGFVHTLPSGRLTPPVSDPPRWSLPSRPENPNPLHHRISPPSLSIQTPPHHVPVTSPPESPPLSRPTASLICKLSSRRLADPPSQIPNPSRLLCSSPRSPNPRQLPAGGAVATEARSLGL
jgi:hypothetical protein